jgi:hypothetical protein
MRGVLLSLVFMLGISSAALAADRTVATPGAPAITAPAPVYAFQVPDKKIEITLGDRSGSAAWYRNPVWVAIGVIAIVLLLLIIVLALRSGGGGGTTIIRE